MSQIERFIFQQYGDDSFNEAWSEFQLWPEEIDWLHVSDCPEAEYMFAVWRLFHWLPDEFDDALPADIPIAIPARLFMEKKKLNPLEKDFLEAALSSPWCFYQVLSVVEGQSMILKNLLSDERVSVIERQASLQSSVGCTLFTKVLQMHDIAFMLGCAPYSFQSHEAMDIFDFREAVLENHDHWYNELIAQYDGELFEFYWGFREAMLNPGLPALHNTDGDELEMHHLVYQVHGSTEEVFAALKHLATGWSDEDFSQTEFYDKQGRLKKVEFPWMKPGNAMHASWENTVFGNLSLTENSLLIEINSRQRCEEIKAIVSECLDQTKVKLQADEIQSIEKMMETMSASQQQEPPSSPELDKVIDDMEFQHWKSWVDTSVPALDELTPREARKTKRGNSRLESLLASFKFRNPAHRQWVYEELGLEWSK